MVKNFCYCLILILCSSPIFGQETLPTGTVPQAIDTPLISSISGQAAQGIVPNQGFSLNSLWRGILGMASMVLIALLLSANRRAINWRTVGIGLSLQLLIAIGVLKVPFVQYIFEKIGQVFVSILEYTRAGSQFLFEGVVVDMDKFGYTFAFQVLPTIIFFSALTSVLFYLGIIQKVVKGLAWLLS